MKATASAILLSSLVGLCVAGATPPPNAVLRPVVNRRAVSVEAALTPHQDVSLAYEGVDSAADALVYADMKLPSVLLEEIDAITAVDCSTADVVVTFGSSDEFEASRSLWPTSDFILFTNHLGDCDAENERGLYLVGAVTFDTGALTVTATASRTELKEQAAYASIDFTSTGSVAPTRRDLTVPVSVDLSGVTLVATDPLTIKANKARLDSTVTFSGHVEYSFETFALKQLYVDVDLASTLNLNVSAAVNGSFTTDLYKYSPASLSISAFSIPGIIDVGPRLEFSVGIEFAAGGTVVASVDVLTKLADGKIHLDFLNSTKTGTSGWTPTTTVASDVDALVELQLNPYADLTVAVGVNLFSNLLDLSAGIQAKPEIINAFSIDLDFAYTSSSGVVFAPPAAGQCTNAAWFASTFHFEVDAFVTQFYTVTLYEVEIPIYKSDCWYFVG